MKVLQIITSAYRATLEEQDDTILWLSAAMTNAGATTSILLWGNAVNYALADQDASGLKIGRWSQTQPPRIASDIERLIQKGVDIYGIAEDVQELGIASEKKINRITWITRAALPSLLRLHRQVFMW